MQPVLVAALADRTDVIRKNAVEILIKSNWFPHNNEEAAFFEMAQDNLNQCIGLGDEGIDALMIPCMRDKLELRKEAIELLATIPYHSISQFLLTLFEDDIEIIKSTLDILAATKDERIVFPVKKLM